MLTPQDVQNKEFTKAVFGGYDMSAVDDFLEVLSEDYAALYKDNAILKGKIKVLVEKVEEYRSTEDAMRMALLTAQKMGDDLVAEAKQKSDALMSQTDFEAKKRMEDVQQQIAAEEQRLALAKAKTAEFVRNFGDMVARHSEFLLKLEEMSAASVPAPAPAAPVIPEPPKPTPAEQKEAEIMSTAEEIGSNVSKFFEDDVGGFDEPAAPIHDDEGEPTRFYRRKNEPTVDFDEDDEPVSPRPKFDFDNLKFGSNYSDDDDE